MQFCYGVEIEHWLIKQITLCQDSWDNLQKLFYLILSSSRLFIKAPGEIADKRIFLSSIHCLLICEFIFATLVGRAFVRFNLDSQLNPFVGIEYAISITKRLNISFDSWKDLVKFSQKQQHENEESRNRQFLHF